MGGDTMSPGGFVVMREHTGQFQPSPVGSRNMLSDIVQEPPPPETAGNLVIVINDVQQTYWNPDQPDDPQNRQRWEEDINAYFARAQQVPSDDWANIFMRVLHPGIIVRDPEPPYGVHEEYWPLTPPGARWPSHVRYAGTIPARPIPQDIDMALGPPLQEPIIDKFAIDRSASIEPEVAQALLNYKDRMPPDRQPEWDLNYGERWIQWATSWLPVP